MATGLGSILDKAVPSGAMSIDVTPGSQYAAMGAAFCNMFAEILKVWDSPEMLAMRQNQDVQALLNQETKDVIAAHESGNLATVNAESAG